MSWPCILLLCLMTVKVISLLNLRANIPVFCMLDHKCDRIWQNQSFTHIQIFDLRQLYIYDAIHLELSFNYFLPSWNNLEDDCMFLHRVIFLKVVKLEVWKTAWFRLHNILQQISGFSQCHEDGRCIIQWVFLTF